MTNEEARETALRLTLNDAGILNVRDTEDAIRKAEQFADFILGTDHAETRARLEAIGELSRPTPQSPLQ